MSRGERFLAASSFSFLALGAVLIWIVWQHRGEGVTAGNVVKGVAAVLAVSLSVQGTRLRHRRSR